MSLVLLVAPSGRGKTTVCETLVAAAQKQAWRVGGVLSPPCWQHGRKTRILLRDVATGETRPLAYPASAPQADVGQWRFVPETVAWGNERLARLRHTDLLVIDEIGPLELCRGQGLQAALQTLQRATYRLAVVTVRPEMAPLLAQHLASRHPTFLELTTQNRGTLPSALLERLAAAA